MITASYPLSHAQEGIWFAEALRGPTRAYHTCELIRVQGWLDIHALTAAVHELVHRHESLRTRFVAVHDEPRQVVDDRSRGAVHVHSAESEGALAQFVDQVTRAPLDLDTGPLFRMDLLRFHDEDHVVAFTIHHIVTDGWSIRLMLEEVSRIYAGLAADDSIPPSYGEFTVWQRETLQGAELDRLNAYWMDHVATAPSMFRPQGGPPPRPGGASVGTLEFSLPADTAERLAEFARSCEATFFMALLGTFAAVLSQAVEAGTVLVGVPVAGRTAPEFADSLGLFANLLPLRIALGDDPAVAELVRRSRSAVLGGLAHQDLPFGKLVAAVNPHRDINTHPLVQVVFQFSEASFESALRLPGTSARTIAVEPVETPYALLVDLTCVPDEVHCRITFDPTAVDPDLAQTIATRFAQLADALPRNPQQPVSEALASCSKEGTAREGGFS